MIYKLMKPVCIFKIINEFMIIIIDVFSVLIICIIEFFYGKIRNTMIYKLMKPVCIFKKINEFMIIIIDAFSIMILCKHCLRFKITIV